MKTNNALEILDTNQSEKRESNLTSSCIILQSNIVLQVNDASPSTEMLSGECTEAKLLRKHGLNRLKIFFVRLFLCE